MADWELKGKPALLILHMQHGIIGKENRAHNDFYKVVKDAKIIPHQQALLKVFRGKSLPVVYVNVKMNKVKGNIP